MREDELWLGDYVNELLDYGYCDGRFQAATSYNQEIFSTRVHARTFWKKKKKKTIYTLQSREHCYVN